MRDNHVRHDVDRAASNYQGFRLRRAARPAPLGGPAKRAMDITLALTALVLLGPLMLLLAAGLGIVFGSPIIATMEWVGSGGRVFAAYTFRIKASPLRKSALDKLPQLFNVLRGDLSFVGTRPVTSEELARYYGAHADDYFRARPGLTGLSQVNSVGRAGKASVALDRCYVRRWSMGLDLILLLKTVLAGLKCNEEHEIALPSRTEPSR